MVWRVLSLPSAPPLPLKLVNDIIASRVQQLLRNKFCNALMSLQQNSCEVQNQEVTGFRGLCVLWLAIEGQIAPLNCTLLVI